MPKSFLFSTFFKKSASGCSNRRRPAAEPTDQPLGVRLRQHTSDRLNGRWDRFSWFGIYPISETGTLHKNSSSQYGIDMLIVTMEALLIEGLEPPQNRKRGDDFRAAEFQQTEDPEIGKARIRLLLEEIQRKM